MSTDPGHPLARLAVGLGRVGYAERLLVALALGWFAVITGRLLLPPLLPTVIDEFGLSLSTAGVLLAAIQFASAAVLYPGGRISDQLGRATVVVPGLGVFAVGMVVIAGAPVYLALLAGAVTMGVGNGLFTVSARAAISDMFTERRGRALGVFAAAFNIGGVVASLVAAMTLERWRLPFVAIAVLLVLVGLLIATWSREPFALERVSIGLRPTARRLVANRDLRVPIIAYSLFILVTQAVFGFYPTFLQQVKGVSPASASAGFALIFVVGAASKVTAGTLSDRAPPRVVALGGIALAAAGLAGIVLLDGVVGLAVATAVFAAGHQAQFPLIDAMLMDAVPAASLGGDIGAARTVFRSVGSLGPVYVGVVAELASLAAAFVGLVVALVVIAGLFWVSTRG